MKSVLRALAGRTFARAARLSRTTWLSFWATALGGALVVSGEGCSKVSEASSGGASSSAAEAPAPGGPARPSFESANYRAEIRATGPCKKDRTCTADVLVEAKGEYHINDKYPYRFKLEDPAPGVKYPKPVVGKEDGKMEERKVVLSVPFVSESTGEKKVSGTLSLSVCSAANCLMDKQPLEVTVKVD
ncbi:MAG TPA: hypothetical protein VF881_16405 [Polyangiaceae bacterium]